MLTPLDAPGTRRIRIVLQTQQNLSHLLLRAALSTAALALPAQIRQFGDPLPARAACSGVLAVLDEVCGLAGCLGFLFVGLAVVGFVEFVDVAAGFGDCFGFLFGGGGVAAGEIGVTFFAPFSRGDVSELFGDWLG
jgi:hypothetical protein